MKRPLIGIVLPLLFAMFLYSDPVESIKIRVIDQKGKPIANVQVEVINTAIKTQSEIDGTLVLENLAGERILLLFTHPDYIPLSEEISLLEETGKVLDIVLTTNNPMLSTIKEEVTVTAEADSIIDINLPSHRTILPSSVLSELGTSNVAEAVEKIPGVALVGKGGYSMVPAIRGLAEHRILLLLDGIRITSERRIGASASFINLNNIDHIEVNRGPYSVFHGSGAIGGIINVVTKSPEAYAPLEGSFHLSYNTVKSERVGSANISGSLGKFGFMLGVNGKKADDYTAPSGKIEQSHYSDYDFLLKVNKQGDNSLLYLTVFHNQGTDIGKPSPTSRLKPRWYPDEKTTLFSLGYETKNKFYLDTLSASLFIMSSSLESQADNLSESLTIQKRNIAEVEGTNYGFKIRGKKDVVENYILNFGIDFFGRGGLGDKNTEWRFDEVGNITSQTDEFSLKDAQRQNFGLYIDNKIFLLPAVTLNIGARFDLIKTSNLDMLSNRISRKDQSLTAYVGSEFQLNPRFSILANVGRSFRFPSISELFYSGLTGRGTVFGNIDLEPEKSLNLDVGFRYLHEKYFVSIYGFRNSVNNMIQKYAGFGEEEFFYRNLSQALISGLEGEFYFSVLKDVELFVNFHLIKGREKDSDTFLNYIPPSRLTLWPKISLGKFWLEPQVILTAAHKYPGPLEQEIGGYSLVNAILGYKLSPKVTFLAIVQNLFDQTYRLSADEQGVDAPGRGFVFKISFSL
ncbi:MAG: TonB-dependent receptor [Candidatus Aminicenantes bacterium]|nr:TonB-dependent receptor [Candidatus Aminicenantes bacterium]